MKKITVLFLMTAILASCGKAKSPDEAAADRKSEAPALEQMEKMDEMLAGDAESKVKKNFESSEGIKSPYYSSFPAAETRMLEYRLNLHYDSEDVLQSRQILLYLVGKYGFIKNGSTSAEGSHPYFSSEVMIKTADLISAMKQFNALGILKSENIEVIDHTPDLVKSNIQKEREIDRAQRRKTYVDRSAAGNRNFTSIEQSLAESENALDNAKFEQWLIEDKVKWVSVSISVTGPLQSRSISIPDYKNAFITLADFFLDILYASIILVPLWIIIGVIYLKRRWIREFFRTGKEK